MIELRIVEEIAQRRELLTACETDVLENHVQAEVAAAIQRLLRDSERRHCRTSMPFLMAADGN